MTFSTVFTLALAVLLGGCAGITHTVENVDGSVETTKIRADINTLASGDLGNTDSTTNGVFGIGGGGRVSNLHQTEAQNYAAYDRPSIKAGNLEIFGTVSTSTVVATQGRSVTGITAELRKWAVRVVGLKALRDVQFSRDQRIVDEKALDTSAAIAETETLVPLAETAIKVPLAEIEAAP